MVINQETGRVYGYNEFQAKEAEARVADNVKQAQKTDEYKASSGDEAKLKYVNLPTKKYIDAVIKSALKNIEIGQNVEENKRVIRIFSGIINENPDALMNISYRV